MTYSVLVVDDDEDDFMLLSAQIKHCHQEVSLTYASSGEEASQQLVNGLHPNLIIIDVQMPRMEGYELLVWLMNSQNWRHIPVVIWTGAISDSEVTRYYRAGANSLLLKQDALQDMEPFAAIGLSWFNCLKLFPANSGKPKQMLLAAPVVVSSDSKPVQPDCGFALTEAYIRTTSAGKY